MEWFLGIVIAAVVGWLLDALFGAPIRSWIQRQMRKVVDVIIRVFVRKKTFDDYFALIGSDRVDYVVYQLGIRPKIPLVDLLYLEFLHSLVVDGRVNKILLFPSIDLSCPSQKREDFEEFGKNVLKVLRKYESQICIVNPFNIAINTENLLSVDFLETVKFIGSRKFIEFISNRLNLKIRNFHDFNKYHPEDIRLLSIYVHLVRGWIMWNYLKENNIIDNTHVNLGFLIWETEVDKLGLFQRVSEQSKNIILTPIIGRTIFFGKTEVVPVFEPDKTLYIFDDFSDIILKLSSKNDKEVRRYIEVLSTILTKNYQENTDLKITYREGIVLLRQYTITDARKLADVNKLTKKGYIILSLIHRLRVKYEGR